MVADDPFSTEQGSGANSGGSGDTSPPAAAAEPAPSHPDTLAPTPVPPTDDAAAAPLDRGRLDEVIAPERDSSPSRQRSRHAHFNLPGRTGSALRRARVQFGHDRIGPNPPAQAADTASATSGETPPPVIVEHAPDLDHVNDALEDYRSRKHSDDYPRVASMASAASMLTSDGEDYDYRLDKDPVPDSEDEEMGDETRAGRRGDTGATEGETLHKLLDSEAASHVHGGYVQLGETDGLPSRPDEEEDDMRVAKNIVRSHTGGHKWNVLRRRVRSGSVAKAAGGENSTKDAQGEGGKKGPVTQGLAAASSSADVEKGLGSLDANDERKTPAAAVNGRLNAPPGVSGNSVLSSLLALYNQPRVDSEPPSTATTPQSSRPPSPTSATPPPHKQWFWKRKTSPPDTSVPPNSKSSPGSPGFSEKKRTKSQTSIADREQPSPGVLASLARHVEELRDDRPKAARSGGGVFGALIQNTAGMAAAAAPSASTLMPAAKRPGYHLTRYSLNEVPTVGRSNPPSRPNSAIGFANLPQRPRSATPTISRQNSTINLHDDDLEPPYRKSYPESMHSTAASEGDLREAKSSDNLLVMKSKNRKSRPTPIPIPSPGTLGLKAVKSAEGWLTGRSAEDLTRLNEEERRKKALVAERKRQKKAREARKKQEVFIIRHVAAILARQQFILKLGRALMMFGSPTHRIETQIQATAKVLDISAQVVYLPNIMLISFADDTMHTSETKFLKQTSTLDLGKLLATHNLYWEVVHDRLSVEDANRELDRLMTCAPLYSWWKMVLIGGLCSAFIVIPSYFGSFLDALMAAPLGMLLIIVQTFAAKNDLFSGVFEITIATFISFVAAALGDTRYFCYTALVSGGIVMILPGYIVLSGSLEIASRNITAGAVRMGYSVIYSLFLGFGISMGAEIYMRIRNRTEITNATDFYCSVTHYEGAPWYMQTPSHYWYFLAVPSFAFFLSLSNQQPIFRKETVVMILFACAGWVTNHFAARAFKDRSDIISALGSFCVGILGNLYGRFFSNGASFPVMVTGILMQLPSGLRAGGLFNFAADAKEGTSRQYSGGFSVAAQLISVAIGLTVGLFIAAVLTNPFGGSRRRGAGIFSF